MPSALADTQGFLVQENNMEMDVPGTTLTPDLLDQEPEASVTLETEEQQNKTKSKPRKRSKKSKKQSASPGVIEVMEAPRFEAQCIYMYFN